MAFGVTAEGFARKTLEDIIEELQADQRATMYDDLDVSDESIVGQQNGIIGNQLAEGWEQLEELYNAADDELATQRALENLCKLFGVYRVGTTKSQVTLTCTLAEGTELRAGEHFAATTDQPDIRWTPVENYTAETTGVQPVDFAAENGGPVTAVAGSITTIATPIVGWSAVSQPSDADPGEYIQDDTVLRQTRRRAIATRGSATTAAILAKVSTEFADELVSVEVYENDSDYPDADGRPPHCVEVLLFDGDPAAIPDNDIAQTIASVTAGGIATYGNSSGTAEVLDGNATAPKTINFSRAVKKDVYATFDVVAGDDYIGDVALKEWIATAANKAHKPGSPVPWSYLLSLTFRTTDANGVTTPTGVTKCNQVRLDFESSPTLQQDLDVAFREIARFSTENIIINST